MQTVGYDLPTYSIKRRDDGDLPSVESILLCSSVPLITIRVKIDPESCCLWSFHVFVSTVPHVRIRPSARRVCNTIQ